MSLITLRPGRGPLIGLAFLLAAIAPGCAWDRVDRCRPDATNVVQRPTYSVEGTKPLYLGGYAGAGTARKMGRTTVRRIVIAIGFGMAISLFIKK